MSAAAHLPALLASGLAGAPSLLIAAVHGAAAVEEKVAVVVLAVLSGLVLVGRPPKVSQRTGAIAMLLALIGTPILLAADIWETSPMRHLRDHAALAAGLVVAGVLLVAALSLLFHRRPRAFPLVAVFALPFRLPISSAGTTANLLVPLYVVVGAGALAYLLPRLRAPSAPSAPSAPAGSPSRRMPAESPPRRDVTGPGRNEPPPRRLTPQRAIDAVQWLLAGSVLLYAIQASYSTDFSKALQNIVFFYVPFSLLFTLLRDIEWDRRLLISCAGISVALAVVFAGVGFVEYQRKALFLNPKVVAANHYDSYFRVNSVFFDPNIYGRYLALVMLIIATGALWARRRRQLALGALALTWLWAGLITSFSQSSMAALLLGLAVLAAFRWNVRYTIYSTVAIGLVGLVVLFAASSSLHLGLTGKGGSANNATNGRAKLIEGGLQLFGERPLYGYGSGSFSTEYKAHQNANTAISTSASHTIPVTVAAEQGVIGLVLYAALLCACLVALLWRAGLSPPRIAIAAAFAGLLLHTMAYADFLEDPTTWTLLGIGVALAVVASEEASSEMLGGALAREAAPSAASPAATPG